MSQELRRWEEACVKAVREAHAEGYAKDMRAWGRTLKDVRLEGEHPDTKLIVDFRDAKHGRDMSWAFDLWDASFEVGLNGERDTPEGVAFVVFVSVASPALPSEER